MPWWEWARVILLVFGIIAIVAGIIFVPAFALAWVLAIVGAPTHLLHRLIWFAGAIISLFIVAKALREGKIGTYLLRFGGALQSLHRTIYRRKSPLSYWTSVIGCALLVLLLLFKAAFG